MTKEEFLPVFNRMEDLCVSAFEGKQVTLKRRDSRLESFWLAFKDRPVEDFERGVQVYSETATEVSFPRPAHILQALRDSQPTYRHAEPPEEQTEEQRERQERLLVDIDEWISSGCCKMDESIVAGGKLGGLRPHALRGRGNGGASSRRLGAVKSSV